MIKLLKQKKLFNFKKFTANILFFKRHSNLFFVLLDTSLRHVATLTSGSCKLGKNKKQKIAALNMQGLVQTFKLNYANKYNIKFLNIYLKQRISYFFFKLRKLLNMYNLPIVKFHYILCKPHSIIRGRKIRRI